MNLAPVYIEITAGLLRALRENDGLEIPLQRASGRLTEDCKKNLATALQKFLDRKTWQPRMKAFCAIPANGVSLRRFSLPASAKDDFQRLLSLQIENEFPLTPDELAWGWQTIATTGNSTRDVLVAAVKKEIVEDYATVLSACGLNPIFTPAALARRSICAPQVTPFAFLDIGREQSELAIFEQDIPMTLRVLPVLATTSIAETVRRALGENWNGHKLFVTGASDELATQLGVHLGNVIVCETLKVESGAGRSAGTVGLKKFIEQHGGSPALVLQAKTRKSGGSLDFSAPDTKRWAMRAAVLLLVLLLLPYAEALVMKPLLARKLNRLKAEKVRLTMIDRELEFLQSLKQNQPPYLDALYIFAKSAPQGSKLDSLTMNRRGDVSLRGSMRTSDQVTDFRSKLIGSGFFSTVAVEEQSPTPDRQKLNIRLSAQWKAASDRIGLTNGPTAAEIERAKTNKPAMGGGGGGGGGFPPGMMPPGMPVMMPDMPGPRPPGR